MSRIFWDSNIFIYLFELHPTWGAPIQEMRQRMLNRNDELLTSWITVSEVQVQPNKLGRPDLCQLYKESIVRSARLLPFAEQAADAFVSIRALGVSSTDSIQLACASAAGTDLFVTNDKKLHSLTVPGINFITSVDRVPF